MILNMTYGSRNSFEGCGMCLPEIHVCCKVFNTEVLVHTIYGELSYLLFVKMYCPFTCILSHVNVYHISYFPDSSML